MKTSELVYALTTLRDLAGDALTDAMQGKRAPNLYPLGQAWRAVETALMKLDLEAK